MVEMKRYFLLLCSLFIGMLAGYFFFIYHPTPEAPIGEKRQIIGFLPYWLLSRAKTHYGPYVTTLTYFGLSIGPDGSIQKLLNPQEEEPGWHALTSGRVNPYLKQAKKDGLIKSLLVFSGDSDTIGRFLAEPRASADNLTRDALPIMKKYGFTDLNLDIEYVPLASDGAREQFSEFVSQVKKNLDISPRKTMTLEMSPDDLIHKKLIDIRKTGQMADYVVLMGYDYHYTGSLVTGPVSPLSGAGINLEYDIETAVTRAEQSVPGKNLILGVPLYGYSWETLSKNPYAPVLPGSGLTISNERAENFLAGCSSCSAKLDIEAEESYVIYKDAVTGTYHQMFFPGRRSMEAKVEFARQEHLGGIALWALGYEGKSILDPLRAYKVKTIYLF